MNAVTCRASPGHRCRSMRWGLVAMLVALATVGAPEPAAADPAGPTNYRSRVTGFATADGGEAPTGVEVEVIGGDAFLAVEVEPGTAVEVPGYEGEPYLRIDENGAVAVNTRSPARWLNDARYGLAEVSPPDQADASAPPVWEQITNTGAYAWHDHRIHYMSTDVPQSVDPDRAEVQTVQDWSVPMTVDDQQVEMQGTLVWLPGPTPAVPLVLLLLAAAIGTAIGWRGGTALLTSVLAVGVGAAAVGVAGSVGLPPGAEAAPVLLVLPVIALLLGLVALAVWRRRPAQAPWLAAVAALPLLGWAGSQAGVLTRPLAPGPLDVWVVRIAVTVSVAAGVAGIVTLARRAVAVVVAPLDATD